LLNVRIDDPLISWKNFRDHAVGYGYPIKTDITVLCGFLPKKENSNNGNILPAVSANPENVHFHLSDNFVRDQRKNYYGRASTPWLSHKSGPHRFVCLLNVPTDRSLNL
jgi:hypothetical protein